jgi:membrane protease YdiL (CAAX protease family)
MILKNYLENYKMSIKSLSLKSRYIIGLIFILGSEFLLRDIFLPETATDIHIGIAILIEWIILFILIFFWIPKVENKKLDSIGFRKFKFRYIGIALLTYFIIMLLWMINYFILKAIGFEGLRSLQEKVKEYSIPTLFGLFITGTFLEEVFYRGYVIERITLLTGKRWFGGLISFLTFTFVHLKFFGLGPTLDVSILSASLVILYLKEKNIWPCIIIHGINDLLGFLIFPIFMR